MYFIYDFSFNKYYYNNVESFFPSYRYSDIDIECSDNISVQMAVGSTLIAWEVITRVYYTNPLSTLTQNTGVTIILGNVKTSFFLSTLYFTLKFK